MDLKGKNVVVAGIGISGISAANLLLEEGTYVTLFDQKTDVDLEKTKKQLKYPEEIKFVLGDLPESVISETNAVILSPGISAKADFLIPFRNSNIPILSEIELAYLCEKGKIAAITGTNGKTTTTALTGEIMKACNDRAFVVGNIGIPYTSVAEKTTQDSVTVAEISSFQLETTIDFKPEVSAVLNVTPDHLDRHGSFKEYAQTKARITENQTSSQVCVLNYDDPVTRKMADQTEAKVVFFSRKKELDEGVFYKDEKIFFKENEVEHVICEKNELHLLGTHNIENVMAAIAISYYMGASLDTIHKVITEFKAVEHRIEYVTTVNDVDYYNDSKGTNPDAAIKGIQAMVKPTILIGGGYDKGVSFDDWIDSFDGKVRYLILLGVTADQIEKTAREHEFSDIVRVDTLEEAVKKAYELAEPGNAVLLSPACASWGMFDNYEQRGRMFKDYVRALEKK